MDTKLEAFADHVLDCDVCMRSPLPGWNKEQDPSKLTAPCPVGVKLADAAGRTYSKESRAEEKG
jgi:hypothetical protein